MLTLAKRSMVLALAALLAVLPIPTSGQGQKRVKSNKPLRWIRIDKSLTVLSPVNLRRHNSYGESGSPTELEEECGYKAIRGFAGGSKAAMFSVLELDPTDCLRKKNETFDERIRGLHFVLGGDDDSDFEVVVKNVNGLDARELKYRKQETRGLMLDGKYKIYVLGLNAQKRSTLDSKAATSFFSSFRFRRPK